MIHANALLLLVLGGAPNAEPMKPPVVVHCHPIWYADFGRRHQNRIYAYETVLMVKSRPRFVREADVLEFPVDRTYYGSPPQSPIRISTDSYDRAWMLKDGKPQIFSFIAIGREYQIDEVVGHEHCFSLENEQDAQALAQTRHNYFVLSSDAIAVGKPEPDHDGIRVERVLFGDLEAGDLIPATSEMLPIPLDGPGPFVYFFAHRDATNTADSALPALRVKSRWSMETLEGVQATLKRRWDFPVTETIDYKGRPARLREITFQGPRRAAIELLGSNRLTISLLGYHRLKQDGEAAIPDLKASIQETLWLDATQPARTFMRQANAIRLLGLVEKYRSNGVVAELIDDVLTQAEQGATFPQPRESKHKTDDWHAYDALNESSNHSLGWLLTQLEPADVTRLYGQRLLRLRDHAAYGWKDEAQFVLDACHVEDHLERAEAQRQTLKLTPVRCESAYPTAAEPPSREVLFEREFIELRFSPDGSQVTGTTYPGASFTWAVDSGKLLERREAPAEPPKREFRRGGEPMQAADGRWWLIEAGESRFYLPARFFDVYVGEKRSQRSGLDAAADVSLTPRRLLGRVTSRWDQDRPRGLVPGNEYFHIGTQIYSRRDLQPVSAVNIGGDLGQLRFSTDGQRYLVTSQRMDERIGKFRGPNRMSNEGVKRLRVQETRTGKTLFCLEYDETVDGHYPVDLSPDGTKLAVSSDEQEVQIWPVGK